MNQFLTSLNSLPSGGEFLFSAPRLRAASEVRGAGGRPGRARSWSARDRLL